MKKKKVYCKNCIHDDIPVFCDRLKNEINKFTGDVKIQFKKHLNVDGNCKHYKKKWCKFWI